MDANPTPPAATPQPPQGPNSDKPPRRRNNRRRRDNRNRNRDGRTPDNRNSDGRNTENRSPDNRRPDNRPKNTSVPQREGQPRDQGRQRDRGRRTGNSRAKKFTGRISDHFSQKDFLCRCGECTQKVRISLGLVGVLEFLRAQVRKRINIVKGYQCQQSHDKTGSYFKNYHIAGIAADIQIDEMTPQEAFLEAEKIPELNGIGLNLDLNLIHIDTRKGAERAEWVVQKGKRIPLDGANRAQFFPL